MIHLHESSGLGRALAKFRPLCGKRIAVLDAPGCDHARLEAITAAFSLAGAEVIVVALEPSAGATSAGGLPQHLALSATAPEVYHCLCVPGSSAAVALLRQSTAACDFVRSFVVHGKWVALFDAAPLLLATIGAARGRTLTSNPALRGTLEQAGAHWTDGPVIADGRLITATGGDALEAFLRVTSLSFRDAHEAAAPAYH